MQPKYEIGATFKVAKLSFVFAGGFHEKKKHKILYLTALRTTIASNNTKILEWEKFAFSQK